MMRRRHVILSRVKNKVALEARRNIIFDASMACHDIAIDFIMMAIGRLSGNGIIKLGT